MESANPEMNLRIVKKSMNGNDIPEENKEKCLPDDQNINLLADQLICSAKKCGASKLHNKHLITVEGIELELPRIKHHAMITRLDESESTPKLDLRTRSVVKSEYKYEHIKSGLQDNLMNINEKVRNFFNNTLSRFHSKPTVSAGSKVFKPRSLFPDAFEPSISSNTTNKILKNKPTQDNNEDKQIYNNLNISISTSSIKVPSKPLNIKVFNSQDGVQVVDNKELVHDGIKVLQNQLHTVPKLFSLDSSKLCATKPQNMKGTEQNWSFKARPATVLRKKPFVPKHKKKYTEPKNICLNTERRAQERLVFELQTKEKFSQYEENTRRRQEEMKKNEMELIKIMRQQTVHKPEPIKKYTPVLIRKSGRPITVPQSPRFSIRPNRNCINHLLTHVNNFKY